MKYSTLFLLLLSLAGVAAADPAEELLAAAKEEQEAFKEGDCAKVESMLAEDITFFANTRKMSREQIGKFCRSLKRTFGAGREPIEDTITPFPLDDDLGYTVRDFRWEDKNNQVVHEVVTKLWERSDGGWKIIHFQSTVMPESGERPGH